MEVSQEGQTGHSPQTDSNMYRFIPIDSKVTTEQRYMPAHVLKDVYIFLSSKLMISIFDRETNNIILMAAVAISN